MKADDAVLGEFKPLAQKLGLKSEQAQELLDIYVKGQTSLEAQRQSAREAEAKGWVEAVKSDKEYGGANLEKNLATAQRAVTKFGGEGLTKFLEETGLGNHPEVVRAFYRVGKAMAEDSLSRTHPTPSNGEMTEAQRLAVMFPTMAQNP